MDLQNDIDLQNDTNSLEYLTAISTKKSENKSTKDTPVPCITDTHSIKIFDMNLSYLTIIVLLCGIILSIFDYTKTNNTNYTTVLIAGYFILYALNINCMTLGNCYYWSMFNVVMLIILTIWAIMHLSEFDKKLINFNKL
jgi:hypothetical protein